MAYVYVKALQGFVGASTDTDPTEGVLQGMRKIDTDTNSMEIYNGSAWVSGGNPVQLSGSKASEYESITVDNTAGGKALTAAKYANCTKALITVETAQVRFTVDGTAPTVAVGHLLNVGDSATLDSAEDIAAFRAIRTGSTSATIHCTYSV